MRKKLFFIIVCMVITLLTPYLLTMLISGKNEVNIYDSDTSGKTVIIKDGETTSKIDVEEFIPLVITAQLPIDWEEEALKAQVVIIRTYIIKNMGDLNEINAEDLKLPFLSYTQLQQTWKENFADNYNKLTKIILDTDFEVIKYKDALINPYFHEASVGLTRNANEVFKTDEYPYLESVESLKDIEAKNYLTIKYLTKEEIIQKLKAYKSELVVDAQTLLESIVINSKCSAGYALEVKVANIIMTGDEFSSCLELNSSFFTIEEFEENVRIITKGIGHGIGLSIYGADILASQGKSYKDILSYYYKNITLESE